jgi:hypothetical protein
MTRACLTGSKVTVMHPHSTVQWPQTAGGPTLGQALTPPVCHVIARAGCIQLHTTPADIYKCLYINPSDLCILWPRWAIKLPLFIIVDFKISTGEELAHFVLLVQL